MCPSMSKLLIQLAIVSQKIEFLRLALWAAARNCSLSVVVKYKRDNTKGNVDQCMFVGEASKEGQSSL